MFSRLENTHAIISGLSEIIQEDTNLRPSQIDILNQYMSDIESHQTGIFDLATGFGKTRIMCMMISAYLRKKSNGRVIVVVPTKDLIRDAGANGFDKKLKEYHARFHDEPLDIGNYYTNGKDTSNQIIVTTYNSLEKLSSQIPVEEIGLLLLDEAHHGISSKRTNAIHLFENAAQYGMTATPWYEPGRDVANVLGKTIARVSLKTAIEDADLSSVKNVLMISDVQVDLTQVSKTSTGDYEESEYLNALRKAMAGNIIYSDNEQSWSNVHHYIAREVARYYHDYIDEDIGSVRGKKCMINCRSQEEARIQAYELNKLFGKMVAGVWTTDMHDKSVLKRFVQDDSDSLPVICQVGRLSEGFDMPNLQMVINYPTCSRVLEAQRSGRVIRVHPNKEMALVVDIAFRHPDFDNEIDAIRQNGQVLYSEILGEPVVYQDVIRNRQGLSKKYMQLERKDESAHIHLNGFHVISNIQELIRIMNEANLLKQNRYVQPIRQGMLTSYGLAERFNISSIKAQKILEKCQYKTYEVDGKKYPLIETVVTSGTVCLALTEHPQGVKTILKIYPDLLIQTIREGMLTPTGLIKKYKIHHRHATKMLNECRDTTFRVDGIDYPLVETVKNGGRTCLALTDHPTGIEKFLELYPHLTAVPLIREGMLTINQLSEKFGFDFVCFKAKILKNKDKVFEVDGVCYPLFEMVNTRGKICWALSDHPKAMAFFLELISSLYGPRIRAGMLSAAEISEKFHIHKTSAARKLNMCKNETFTVNGETYPLVELMNIQGRRCYALSEHPQAMKVFLNLFPDLLVPEIRKGMLTSYELAEKLGADRGKIGKLFKMCIGKTFTVDGHIYPLIEQVKKLGNVWLALSEHPQAISEFLNLFPKLRGRIKITSYQGQKNNLPNKNNQHNNG